MAGWIGVDLDGTLAHYGKWIHIEHIGDPVRPMQDRVKAWLDEGRDVRIVTARVSHDGSAARMVEAQRAMVAIMRWCEEHLGRALPVTCSKDYAMVEIWDDRAVQVIPNSGLRADGKR